MILFLSWFESEKPPQAHTGMALKEQVWPGWRKCFPGGGLPGFKSLCLA